MDQKNILPRGIAKPIEQQPDGKTARGLLP